MEKSVILVSANS